MRRLLLQGKLFFRRGQSKIYVDIQEVVRGVIKKLDTLKVSISLIINLGFFRDSRAIDDIHRGVVKENNQEQGADQGIMFVYATNETKNYIPIGLDISNKILQELVALRRENDEIKYLRPDSKSQVTIEYSDDNKPQNKTIVVSTQHDDFDVEAEMLNT